MKKIAAFILILLIIFTIPSVKYRNNCIAILETFNDSNIQLESINMSGWVNLDQKYISQESLESVAIEIGNSMGISDFTCSYIINESNQGTEIKEKYNKGIINIYVGKGYNCISKKSESTAAIDITQEDNMQNIIDSLDSIVNCLKKYNNKVNTDFCICGYINGEIDKYEKEYALDKLFLKLNAKEVEKIDSNNLISISGYTDNITNYIKSNNLKVNINAACRYSSSYNKTYFYLGTPVINVEY